MEQREKLIELIREFLCKSADGESMADHLLANGVVVLPCRCGECEHRDGYECEKMYDHLNECQGIKTDIDLDWYCADAKRKGGE